MPDFTEKHCGVCVSHTFQGLNNFCEVWERIIPRDRWVEKKPDGSFVCSCGRFEHWKEPKRWPSREGV